MTEIYDEKASKKSAAVVHVDLDGAWAIFEANGKSYNRADDPLFVTGLQNLLSLFDGHRIKATLFTIAEDVKDARKRELLREAVGRGHEIASHSVTHRRLDGLSLEEKRVEIAESRELLQSALGVDVKGFRAPSYSIDRECIELLSELGYQFDSSVFPTPSFARRIGVPAIPGAPHRPFEDSKLLELPLPSYRPAPFPFHPSYSLILGSKYFQWGLRRALRSKLPLIVLFHLTDAAEPLPPEQLPGWRLKLMTLSHIDAETKRGKCDAMLNLVEDHFSLTGTQDLIGQAESRISEGGPC